MVSKTLNSENTMDMPIEIFGIEFDAIVKFDYSPYYRGDPERFGKEGRIDWGTPEEPEEYTINSLFIKEYVRVNEYNEKDISFLLAESELVDNIEDYLRNERES